MRHKCIPFILLLIIVTGLTSCGKAAGTGSFGGPETAKASDGSAAVSSDRIAGDNDTPDLPAGNEASGSAAAAGTDHSSLSADTDNPALSAGTADSSPASGTTDPALTADTDTDPSKIQDPEDKMFQGMNHSAVRRRPEHTEEDLVYNPPAPQAPATWTNPGTKSQNSSGSSSKEKKEKKKSKKGNRIGSSMGGGGY